MFWDLIELLNLCQNYLLFWRNWINWQPRLYEIARMIENADAIVCSPLIGDSLIITFLQSIIDVGLFAVVFELEFWERKPCMQFILWSLRKC